MYKTGLIVIRKKLSLMLRIILIELKCQKKAQCYLLIFVFNRCKTRIKLRQGYSLENVESSKKKEKKKFNHLINE